MIALRSHFIVVSSSFGWMNRAACKRPHGRVYSLDVRGEYEADHFGILRNMRVGSIIAAILAVSALFPFAAFAQEIVLDTQVTMRAKVLRVLGEEERFIPGTETKSLYQRIEIELLDGSEAGKTVTIENDYLQLKAGETFYVMHTTNDLDGTDAYTVLEPYRLRALFAFLGLFVLCVLLFGGLPGIRGLLALALSILFIFFLLFPAILKGYSPILVSVGVSSVIIILGSYITHGVNRTTSAAVIGMIGTIMLTGGLAFAAVHATRLSGFASEEAIYLNFNTQGAIDFSGLLLGGILIGLLGVLYDAAIGQAVAVEELNRAGAHLSRRHVMARALRMGREHIGALVNTLAIAYVGASLPLLLLFYSSASEGIMVTLNREIFADEITRIVVGSIGLILAVPITTAIATFMNVGRASAPRPAPLTKDASGE